MSKITDIYSSKAFRAAKRALDIKYTKAERAIQSAGIPGSKEYLVKLKEAYIKEVKALYNAPEEVKALAPVPKKKAPVAGKKAAKKVYKKKPVAADEEDTDDAADIV